MKKIQVLGSAQKNKHQSGLIYGVGGVSPTIPAFTHGYALGWFLTKEVVYEEQNNRPGQLPQE